MRELILAFFVVLLCCSCATTRYTDHYAAVANSSEYIFSTDAPILMEIVNEHTYQDVLNQGYMLIGTSGFYAPWQGRVDAINCAKNFGASLLLFTYQQGESETRSITRYVEQSQTTYYQGVTYGRHWRPVPYQEAVTTYYTVPVTHNYVVNFYQQNCYFMAKRRYQNAFGVYFSVPQNTPGSGEAKVIIEAVTPNSPAAKKGLAPGYAVKSVNGIPINGRKDILPFISNQQEITSVEVVNE